MPGARGTVEQLPVVGREGLDECAWGCVLQPHARGSSNAWRWQAWLSAPFAGLTSSGPRLLQQADDYIHANEVILTFGMSETTSLFLQEAARKRDFQVGSNILPEAWQHGPACLVLHYMAGACRPATRELSPRTTRQKGCWQLLTMSSCRTDSRVAARACQPHGRSALQPARRPVYSELMCACRWWWLRGHLGMGGMSTPGSWLQRESLPLPSQTLPSLP